ncbi:MAG: glycosyltransferase family 4 protein [Kordiimonadaceae bacterium]|nr:glycosyltransferase family 4 protein [Kordiimonadaceae bacterium]
MATIVLSANTTWYLFNFRARTIEALISCGHTIILVSPFDDYVERLVDLGCRHIDISIDRGGTNPVKDFRTFVAFLWVYIRIRPHAVLNFTPKNNIYGALAAQLVGAVTINNISGLGSFDKMPKFKRKILLFLYRASQYFTPQIFFQNQEDERVFSQHKIASSAKKDRIAGSGVDLARFNPTELEIDCPLHFLFIGRYLKEKGIRLFCTAAESLKQQYGAEVEFSIVGFVDESNPSSLTKKELADIELAGFVQNLGFTDCVEEIIAKSHCVVLPSYYGEGVPRSLLEAAAMMRPIITTDHTGCRDAVDHEINGFLCSPGDLTSLRDAMVECFNTPRDRLVEMGRLGRAKMEREFSETVIIDAYVKAVTNSLK